MGCALKVRKRKALAGPVCRKEVVEPTNVERVTALAFPSGTFSFVHSSEHLHLPRCMAPSLLGSVEQNVAIDAAQCTS